MSTGNPGEWIWRFLAGAMLFAICWAVWVIYQLNPQSPLVLNPAFEAAAKARVRDALGEKQNAQGVIAPSAGAGGPANPADAAAPAAATPAVTTPPAAEAPKVPLVNPEKLRFSDTIAIPVIPNAKQ